MKKLGLALLLCLWWTSLALSASLLPNGKQQFFNSDGQPLSGGNVFFYIPGTTTPKDTYQDSGGTILNTNPVQLDAGGFGLIYGSGAYRQVVQDALGNTIYDQITSDTSSANSSWAGTGGGSANAITLVAPAFSGNNGQTVSWRNAATNTGPATVTISGNTYTIVKDTATGVAPLIGGEMVVGGISTVTYDTVLGQMHLMVPVSVQPVLSIASAATTNVGSLGTHNVNVTGTASIVSLGSSATVNDPIYYLTFASNVVLTHNAVSLILPGGVNITTVAGAYATAQYLGSGNWKILDYSFGTGVAPEFVNSRSGATYTVVGTDLGKMLSLNTSTTMAVTIPQATAAFPNGSWFDVQSIGTGTVTLTPTTSTINGLASYLLPSGYSARIVSDGLNWQAIGFNPLKGRVLLSTVSGTGVGSLDDITSFTANFANYEIEFNNLVGSVIPPSSIQMLLQVYSGGAYQSGSYQATLIKGNSAGVASVTGTSAVILSDGTTNSGAGVSGRVTILGAGGTTNKKYWFGTTVDQSLAVPIATGVVGGTWNGGNGAVAGFRIVPSSGNVTGTMKVYGYN